MMPLSLDWNFLTGIYHATLLVAGLGGLYIAQKIALSGLQRDVRRLEDAFKQLGSVLTQLALQDQRLHMMEKSIDELRHGKGFIEKES